MNDWISDFRGGRSQGNLGAWVLAATLLSVGLHLILWKYAGNLGLPEHFGGVAADTAVEQRIPVDLRRARINEEAAMPPAPPAAALGPRCGEPTAGYGLLHDLGRCFRRPHRFVGLLSRGHDRLGAAVPHTQLDPNARPRRGGGEQQRRRGDLRR